MRSTNTQIMWPPKLKPGTKSKKDPHVRITGSPNSINAAKEIIFEQLDTRRNRVTLKMDVAFTDHSHIIGKGGRSIQRVMDETGCHIHFPDSNRTNTAEKSNQVSIAGSAEGVEQSRCRIREMLPITLQFDLPLNNGLHSPPTLDPQSPQLQAIQQSYGITITFRCDSSKCNNNSYFASSRIITVAVRGARSHLFGLRQGISVLIEYLTGFRASTINVPLTMTIDVAVQHHSFIAGRANCNLRSIMQSTGAVITMPDLTTTTTPSSNDNNNNISNSSSSASIVAAAAAALSAANITSSSIENHTTLTSAQSLTNLTSSASSSINDLASLCGSGNGSSSMQQQTASSFLNAAVSSLANSQGGFHGSNQNLAASMNSMTNRKTAIVIKGPNFESVYSAWQELLGYLPLILIFDLKEGQDLDPVQVTKLMEQMRQISILIKPKQRQNTKSIVVRGPEKDSRLLFEVRKQVLKLDDFELASIDSLIDHHLQQQHQLQKQQQLLALDDGHVTPSSQPTTTASNSPSNSTVSSQNNTNQLSTELQMKAIRAILDPNFDKTRQPTPYWAGLGFSKSVSEPMMKEKLSIGPLFSSNLADERRISYSNEGVALQELASGLQSLSLTSTSDQQQQQQKQLHQQLATSANAESTSVNGSCVSGKIFTGFNNNNSNKNTHSSSSALIMDSNNNTPTTATSSAKQTKSTFDHVNNNRYNYTNNQHQQQHYERQGSSSGHNQNLTSCLKLAMFLARYQLVQYLSLFTQHDIDLEMLLSLTEDDFAKLGINYGHRRKLTLAIAEVKSTIQSVSGNRSLSSASSSTFDAAPGAERSRRHKDNISSTSNVVGGQSSQNSGQGELSDIWSM